MGKQIKKGERIIIHKCSQCGRWEGEVPQATCCPGCGFASQAIKVYVSVVGRVSKYADND